MLVGLANPCLARPLGPLPPPPQNHAAAPVSRSLSRAGGPPAPHRRRPSPVVCRARRRTVRYGGDDEDGAVEYGHHPDIAMLESYSETRRDEALLVRASLDGGEEEVLIFKGFSSLLSSGTSSDPSRSVLPARAVVKTVDVVRGPFDPSNVEYLEKGLALEAFKERVKQSL